MDYNTIKNLLDKYWEGETSIQEEALLKQYFNGTNIADNLKQFQPLFAYFEQAGQQTSKQNFEQVTTTKTRRLIPQQWIVAASILLLVVAGFAYKSMEIPAKDPQLMAEDTGDTYQDPKEAYKEAKAALMLISKKLNKGIDKTTATVRRIRE